MKPERIGELTILSQLGSGAGSQVFHVQRRADAHEYALKVVSVASPSQRRYLAQLKHEFRIGKKLDHPNLIQHYLLEVETNWFFQPKRAKLLMEYAPGCRLDRLPSLKPVRWLGIFAQVASAIAHLHEAGFCHSDLKPENIILGPGDDVKVIDFGLAHRVGDPCERVRGTPEFMAPETKNRKLINPRTDIFNLGATMYRMLTQRNLPQSSPGLAFERKSYNRMVVPIATVNPEACNELCELVYGCIGYNPQERPETMSEIHATLQRLVAEHVSA